MNNIEYSQNINEQIFEFLDNELKSNRPFTHTGAELDTNARTVIDCLTVVANHVEKYGTKGIGSFINSEIHYLLRIHERCADF